MSILLQDARIAIRFLLRNRLFAVASIAILALGISLSTALFAIVNGALVEPWPYQGYDRIVTVRGTYPSLGRTASSLWSVAEIEDLRRAGDVFAYVIAGDARNVNLTYAGRPERVRAAVITPNAFAMLGVPALAGRTLADADGRPGAAPVVVVSFRFWQTRLGADPRAIGATLRIADAPYLIAGVMPQSFVFWDRDLWMPLSLDPTEARGDRRYYVQAQLRPGVPLERATSRLRVLAAQMATDHPDRAEYLGLAISLNALVEDVLRDLRPTLYMLLGAVALVLVIAIANLGNAMLAKGMAREGELAIRRAIGGSAGQLARQLLVESAIVGAGGGGLGAAAAAFLLPYLLSLIPFGYVPAEARVLLDWRVVVAAGGCAVACGLLIGVVPALRAASIDPAVLLKQADSRTASGRHHRWRDAFVAAQLVLAIVVLGVASSAWSSLHDAVGRDPGYQTAGIWTARIAMPSAAAAAQRGADTYARILRALRETGGISDVALASALPVGDLPTLIASAETAGSMQRMASLEAASIAVSPGFFHVLGVPILNGRSFADDDDRTRPPVAVVSQSLARRLWPDGPVLGRQLVLGSGDTARDAVVVGVAGDVAPVTSNGRIEPMVFLPIAQRPPVSVVVALKTMDSTRALVDVDAAVHSVDSTLPVYGPEMLAQARVAALGPKLLAVTLLGVFAVAVLALSAAGIYAVVSQSVQERGQELRIRLTFGAEPRQLFAHELWRAGRLAIACAISGAGIAFGVLRLVAATFAGFAGAIAWPLAASTALLIVLALIATALPAYHACRRDVLRRA
jgi:putative ABC transport system permease protein